VEAKKNETLHAQHAFSVV